jgi:hypothetical protein
VTAARENYSIAHNEIASAGRAGTGSDVGAARWAWFGMRCGSWVTGPTRTFAELGQHALPDHRPQFAQQVRVADGVVATPLAAGVEQVTGRAGTPVSTPPSCSHPD